MFQGINVVYNDKKKTHDTREYRPTRNAVRFRFLSNQINSAVQGFCLRYRWKAVKNCYAECGNSKTKTPSADDRSTPAPRPGGWRGKGGSCDARLGGGRGFDVLAVVLIEAGPADIFIIIVLGLRRSLIPFPSRTNSSPDRLGGRRGLKFTAGCSWGPRPRSMTSFWGSFAGGRPEVCTRRTS